MIVINLVHFSKDLCHYMFIKCARFIQFEDDLVSQRAPLSLTALHVIFTVVWLLSLLLFSRVFLCAKLISILLCKYSLCSVGLCYNNTFRNFACKTLNLPNGLKNNMEKCAEQPEQVMVH